MLEMLQIHAWNLGIPDRGMNLRKLHSDAFSSSMREGLGCFQETG
jgi:hypothetical protein